MWTTVIVLALALNLEPNRLVIIGLLLVRPHPIRQLMVFMSTSFLMSATAGLIVLFVAHQGSLGKGGSTSAIMQIVIGAVALIAAAILSTNIAFGERKGRVTISTGGTAVPEPDTQPTSGSGLVDNFTRRFGGLAHGNSSWLAFALGIGISLPSVDYVALLLLIATAGVSPEVQVVALFAFLAIANAILAIPILSYLVSKERTIRVLERVRTWVLARGRRDYAMLLAIAGGLMITVGLTRL